MTQEEENQILQEENQQLKKEIEEHKAQQKRSRKLKIWFAKLGTTIFIGLRLKQSILNALNEFKENKELSKETMADLAASVIWRFTRIGIIALFISVLPSLLLWRQNILFNRQNAKIEIQNKRIEQQTHLAEGSRRSTQMFIMGEVLSDINKELKEIKNKQEEDYTTEVKLSKVLKSRIISLSRAMKPYKYLDIENDTLTMPSSPERGQLLIVLIESDVDLETSEEYRNVSGSFISRSDFSYAELQHLNIAFKNLNNLKLSFANLSRSVINDVNFKNTDFSNTKMILTDFTDTELDMSNFKQSTINFSSFISCSMNNIDFSSANLDNTSFYKSDLKHSTFQNTNLKNANFENADLSDAEFNGADLTGVNLKGATLNKTNFENVKSLDSALVGKKDWFHHIKNNLDLPGADQLVENYKIEPFKSNGIIISNIFIILKINPSNYELRE